MSHRICWRDSWSLIYIINFDSLNHDEKLLYNIRIFELSTGECPFNDWLKRLDKTASARIDARLTRLYFGIFKKDLILLVLLGGDKSSQSADIAKAQRLWQSYLEEKHGSDT
jgi:putative component of toxin-antitoxin plasmid stabilization module